MPSFTFTREEEELKIRKKKDEGGNAETALKEGVSQYGAVVLAPNCKAPAAAQSTGTMGSPTSTMFTGTVACSSDLRISATRIRSNSHLANCRSFSRA
jgi:hypothetical protein